MVILKLMSVRGQSMSPYLNEGALLLVSYIPLLFSKAKVGDVVVLKDPRDNRKIIKRVSKVENGRYFVLGDNVSESTDSRHFGYVDKQRLIAKMLVKLN